MVRQNGIIFCKFLWNTLRGWIVFEAEENKSRLGPAEKKGHSHRVTPS